jgi:hypothetical protein
MVDGDKEPQRPKQKHQLAPIILIMERRVQESCLQHAAFSDEFLGMALYVLMCCEERVIF